MLLSDGVGERPFVDMAFATVDARVKVFLVVVGDVEILLRLMVLRRRLMVTFRIHGGEMLHKVGLMGEMPWLKGSDGALCAARGQVERLLEIAPPQLLRLTMVVKDLTWMREGRRRLGVVHHDDGRRRGRHRREAHCVGRRHGGWTIRGDRGVVHGLHTLRAVHARLPHQTIGAEDVLPGG